jgi:protein Mpv17
MTTRRLLLILGLCCPSLAFSTFAGAKASRNVGVSFASSHQTNLFFRGGDQQEPDHVIHEEPVVVLAEEVVAMKEPSTSPLSAVTIPMFSALSTFGKAYAASLAARPILTKSATAGLIFALSDYLAQALEKDKTKATNWTRTIMSAVVGFCYFGPAAHYWYSMIFRLLPGTSLFSTLQKAGLGQLIFGPTFTCIFFASALLQGGNFTVNNWIRKVRSDLPGAWAAGLCFWPFVDLVSYRMVAPQWIPLFVNMCSLVWTIYLSGVANKAKVE